MEILESTRWKRAEEGYSIRNVVVVCCLYQTNLLLPAESVSSSCWWWGLKRSWIWARIFKLLRSPGIDSNKPIPPAYVTLARRCNNPIPTWFLAPIECLKIPALMAQPIAPFQRTVIWEVWLGAISLVKEPGPKSRGTEYLQFTHLLYMHSCILFISKQGGL